jgi:hypothetical protein
MLVLLAVRHGHTGLGALFSVGLLVGVGTSPAVSSLRLCLSDRMTAARAVLFAPESASAHSDVTVIRHLAFPQRVVSAGGESATTLAAAAIRAYSGSPSVVVPCCSETAASYASCEGVTWAPLHAPVNRSVLIFAPTG